MSIARKGGAVSINGFAGKVDSVRDSDPVVGWSFRGITGVRAKKNGRSIKRLPAFLWLLESFDTSLIKNRGFGFDKLCIFYRSCMILEGREVCMIEGRWTMARDGVHRRGIFIFCLLIVDTKDM